MVKKIRNTGISVNVLLFIFIIYVGSGGGDGVSHLQFSVHVCPIVGHAELSHSSSFSTMLFPHVGCCSLTQPLINIIDITAIIMVIVFNI